MDKSRTKTKEIADGEAVCATETTGLIPALPENIREKENYYEILHYKSNGKTEKKKRK